MLQKLKTQHREIARLRFEGKKSAEIASLMDMRVETVRQILRDPICQAAIERLNLSADDNAIDVRKRLSELNAKALDTIEECMDQDLSQAVRLSAAKDVLDRNGYAPRQAIDHTHLHLTSDELAGIKERAKAAVGITIVDESTIEGEFTETLEVESVHQ